MTVQVASDSLKKAYINKIEIFFPEVCVLQLKRWFRRGHRLLKQCSLQLTQQALNAAGIVGTQKIIC